MMRVEDLRLYSYVGSDPLVSDRLSVHRKAVGSYGVLPDSAKYYRRFALMIITASCSWAALEMACGRITKIADSRTGPLCCSERPGGQSNELFWQPALVCMVAWTSEQCFVAA